MKFNFDGKEYDSEKLSDNGKICLARLQNIKNKKDSLTLEFSELNVIEKHYAEELRKNLPKEDKEKQQWITL